MKKMCIILGFLIVLAGVTGCQKVENDKRITGAMILDYSNIKANCVMLDMWEAIESKNGGVIKELLSSEAKTTITELDTKINTFVNFIQGDITKCTTMLAGSGISRAEGKVYYEIRGQYIIETTENNYRVYFIYIARDDHDEETEGISRIDVVTQEYEEKSNEWGGREPDICVWGE